MAQDDQTCTDPDCRECFPPITRNPYTMSDGSPILCDDDLDTFWYSERAAEWEANRRAEEAPEMWKRPETHRDECCCLLCDPPYCYECNNFEDDCTCPREHGPWEWELAPAETVGSYRYDSEFPADIPF